MSYNILKLEMEKMLFSISSKYSYFKPIFNYTKKGLWKGILIYRNYDTLVCFCPKLHVVLPNFNHPIHQVL
jgi:hypothetical protein